MIPQTYPLLMPRPVKRYFLFRAIMLAVLGLVLGAAAFAGDVTYHFQNARTDGVGAWVQLITDGTPSIAQPMTIPAGVTAAVTITGQTHFVFNSGGSNDDYYDSGSFPPPTGSGAVLNTDGTVTHYWSGDFPGGGAGGGGGSGGAIPSEPKLITAFVMGFLFPVGLFGIWLAVKAVKKGISLGKGFNDDSL